MKKQTGIWIDAKKAVIVHLGTDKPEINTVLSAIEKKDRVPGEGKSFTRMGTQFFSTEQKKQAQMAKEAQNYFGDIHQEIKETGALVLFGPASKKNELEKYLLSNGITQMVIQGVETTDSMTENQMAAWVKKYFEQ